MLSGGISGSQTEGQSCQATLNPQQWVVAAPTGPYGAIVSPNFPPLLQYVEEVLRSQQPLVIFLEEPCALWHLSSPARAWLAPVYRAVQDGAVPDILLVPVGIAYDQTPDRFCMNGAVRLHTAPQLGIGASLLSPPSNAAFPLPPAQRSAPRPRGLPLGCVPSPVPMLRLRSCGLGPALLLAGTVVGSSWGSCGRAGSQSPARSPGDMVQQGLGLCEPCGIAQRGLGCWGDLQRFHEPVGQLLEGLKAMSRLWAAGIHGLCAPLQEFVAQSLICRSTMGKPLEELLPTILGVL